MKKLEIEVLGSMYKDWDDEEFSWDVDNIIKVKLDNQLVINKRFGEFTIDEDETDLDNGIYKPAILPNYYLIDYVGSCSIKSESGDTVRLPYAYCNLKSEGDITIKYGKWHLKAELEVENEFKLSDLVFVRLDNLIEAIDSGEPGFASLILLPGKGCVNFSEFASNIKDTYECFME
jgi:hypothetical protein